MLTTSSLKSSQQMKSTITCKQPHPQSVQSGSKQFKQFLGLENEDDLPGRRQPTDISYSKLNRNCSISLRESNIIQKGILRLVGWGWGWVVSFSSVVGTNKLTFFHLCYSNILLNYSIEHAILVCAAWNNQSTLGRWYLISFPAATADSENFTINRGPSHVTGRKGGTQLVTCYSACVVFQYLQIFQSLPKTNFILSSLPDLFYFLFTYTSNAIDLRKEINSLGNLIQSFIILQH